MAAEIVVKDNDAFKARIAQDGTEVDVTGAQLKKMNTLYQFVKDGALDEDDPYIPIMNVSSSEFITVIRYIELHAADDPSAAAEGAASGAPAVSDEDSKLLRNDTKTTEEHMAFLFSMLLAANFLEVNSLMSTLATIIAQYTMNMSTTPENIPRLFGIKQALPADVVQATRAANLWLGPAVA